MTTQQKGISLATPIADLEGVGRTRAAALRRLDLRTVADLVRYLPYRYEHELGRQNIADVIELVKASGDAGANVSVRGEVLAVRTAPGRRPRVEATVGDGTATISAVWFNAVWVRKRLHPGLHVDLTGKTKIRGEHLQIVNPKWSLVTADEDDSNEDGSAATARGEAGDRDASAHVPADESPQPRWRPVYSASEDITSATIERLIDRVLDDATALIEDHLPEDYRLDKAMPTLAEAYRMMHRPADEEEIKAARRRLAFDELLLLQLGVMLKRRHRRETLKAPALRHSPAVHEHILERLPFELTPGQAQAVQEIAADLTAPTPMNRLLQGDVGAGKTVVALYAMLMAVANGHQAALMAPTELLAEQHFASISAMLDGSRVSIELLTGSRKKPTRELIHDRLADGSIDILIGTHALLTEAVRFQNLAVAVIDEQHRFGVHQRASLRSKSDDAQTTPHVLVMTATPIPRTLSITIFGDLDVSTIRGLPPGRQPIITKWVRPAKQSIVYEYVHGRLEAGEQAYIVVPAVDESTLGLTDVQSHLQWLSDGPLAGQRLAGVHGRLKREEREHIMKQFRAGEIDALVATTVIEVGVDVPNATMMIVEHADRFGLAQLHQLRGRVGRGEKKSLCTLIAEPKTDDAEARLRAVVSTGDGFAIAEKDLEIRGPGELFGARQAGVAPFEVADLTRDLALLRMARRDAAAWIKRNPALTGERDALLRKRLLKVHGQWLGLADVA